MLKEKDLSKEIIKELLENDTIDRNKHLNKFISFLNSVDENNVFAIDGKWGTGKTIFVKQIEYLNSQTSCLDEEYKEIEKKTINEFQNKYISFYYNAWENDYHTDPLQSLLFNIINEMWTKNDEIKEKINNAFQGIKESLKASATKVLSYGIIDYDKIKDIESMEDLITEIRTTEKRKNAINDILNKYMGLEEKQLLFIIDELDRCNPSFAVKLLETIKHYFDNDKIVFLIATNNIQLSHTIKKYYGNNFDGSGYLNKFYDLIFDLAEINRKNYLLYIGEKPGNSYYKNMSPEAVVNYLDFSMREIDRYYTTLKLLQNYFDRNISGVNNRNAILFIRFIFIPLAYGLKIKNFEEYNNFITGKNAEILQKFLEYNDLAVKIIRPTEENNHNIVDEVVDFYKSMFGKDYEDSWYDPRENFLSTVSLLNSVEIIKNDE